MTEEEIIRIIEETIGALLDQLNVTGTVGVQKTALGYQAAIKSPDSALLIGAHGQTLSALDHLVRAFVFRQTPADQLLPEIHVDVEGYKQRQIDEIVTLATQTADHVTTTHQPEVLRPMSGYERRIIHMTLADRADVVTESIGDGLARRIVVKPKSMNEE